MKTAKLDTARFYRQQHRSEGLVACEVRVQETDLHIMASRPVEEEARELVLTCRSQLERYITRYPDFVSSLVPMAEDSLAPAMVKEMLAAGRAAQVGPMAAVAGAVASFVGQGLLQLQGVDEVVVENGGDIFVCRRRECISAIYAGDSPLSNKVGLKIAPGQMPLGVCTSSGTIGHSLSLGQADSVTVLARNTALADAVATRLGNGLADKADINTALALGQSIAGVQGVLIIVDDQLGAWGQLELLQL